MTGREGWVRRAMIGAITSCACAPWPGLLVVTVPAARFGYKHWSGRAAAASSNVMDTSLQLPFQIVGEGGWVVSDTG